MFDQSTYSPELIKAYENYAKYHNDWCDKYGYGRLKL